MRAVALVPDRCIPVMIKLIARLLFLPSWRVRRPRRGLWARPTVEQAVEKRTHGLGAEPLLDEPLASPGQLEPEVVVPHQADDAIGELGGLVGHEGMHAIVDVYPLGRDRGH